MSGGILIHRQSRTKSVFCLRYSNQRIFNLNRLNPQILWKLRYKINLTPPQYWANVGNSIKPSGLMFLFLDFKTSKTLVIGSFYFLVLLSLFDISATDC